jgi:hypothetical protein
MAILTNATPSKKVAGEPGATGNGATEPVAADESNKLKLATIGPQLVPTVDHAALDEAEQLLAATMLTHDDADEPGERDEVKIPLFTKKLPQFAIFMAQFVVDVWAAPVRDGMEDTIVITTKAFAPNFENDLELKRCRIYETVTANDNVVRLTFAFIPEARDKTGNAWTISRFNAFEHATRVWTTMRSRQKLGQYSSGPRLRITGRRDLAA